MNFLKKLIIKAYEWLFKLVGMIPPNKKLVMFESFLGKQYSDSPRAIYEYMKENNPDYTLYWSIDPRYIKVFTENNIPYIKRFSAKWLFYMARAKYWVTNSRMPIWIPKPKHTTYLQTWHGTPLKKLAADIAEVHMPGTNTNEYKQEFLKESRNWDYLISPNPYSTEIFRRAFQFDKQILETGYPRNDILSKANNESYIRKLKQKVKLPEDKKIILYAPTWRDNQHSGVGRYTFNLELDLKRMYEQLGTEYIVVLRMHYLVSQHLDLGSFEGFAYDFSSYEDIRDLYLLADMLITDYSSVFFDYAILKRPILFFVYDIDSYRDQLRGFYFDLEKQAPGPLVLTTEELINSIKQIEKTAFLPESYNEFYNKFCSLESGESTRKVVEAVFK